MVCGDDRNSAVYKEKSFVSFFFEDKLTPLFLFDDWALKINWLDQSQGWAVLKKRTICKSESGESRIRFRYYWLRWICIYICISICICLCLYLCLYLFCIYICLSNLQSGGGGHHRIRFKHSWLHSIESGGHQKIYSMHDDIALSQKDKTKQMWPVWLCILIGTLENLREEKSKSCSDDGTANDDTVNDWKGQLTLYSRKKTIRQ